MVLNNPPLSVSFAVGFNGNWCIIAWIQHDHQLSLSMLMCLYGAKTLFIYRSQLNHCSVPTLWTVKNDTTPKTACVLFVRKLFHAFSSLCCGRYVCMQSAKQLVNASGLIFFSLMMVVVPKQYTDIIARLGALRATHGWSAGILLMCLVYVSQL